MMLWVCPNKWAKRKKRLSEGIKCVVPKRGFFEAQSIDNKELFLKHHEFRLSLPELGVPDRTHSESGLVN